MISQQKCLYPFFNNNVRSERILPSLKFADITLVFKNGLTKYERYRSVSIISRETLIQTNILINVLRASTLRCVRKGLCRHLCLFAMRGKEKVCIENFPSITD